MTELTTKQSAFARNKAAGMKNREAAVAAGYAANSADVQAANLLRRDDIKKAIRQAKRHIQSGADAEGVNLAAEAGVDARKNTMPKAKYTDSKEFLLDAMNHAALPIAARADYAKALLPYQHSRLGETGKKAKAKENAHALSKTPGKFQTKRPPANVVNIGDAKRA